MKTSTYLWLAWGLAFLAIEGWAFLRQSYADTLTGHVRALMQSSGVLMILVPTLVVGVAIHLLVEALRR